MMDYRIKKMVPLLALLMFMAGAVPAWSADEIPGDSPAVTEPSGGTATDQGAADQVPPPEAVVSEPLPGEVSAATQTGSEPHTGSAGVETLQESFSPANWLVYKPLWALTNWVGDFNPIGKYVSDPLEEAIPGLRVKGFINSITQINTTSRNDNVPQGGRKKDWWLQKQEFRTQLELKYQANENIELVNINNFQYDGSYDFQGSDGLYLDGSNNQKYYNQGKRIIREAYVRGNYGNVNFTLGKQIVNWGKMDGKVIDIVNAADGRDVVDFHSGDYEWRAIGQWMAYLSLRPTEKFTISALWNPDFQPNTGPAGGSPYWYPWAASPTANTPKTAEYKPSGFDKIQDSEIGLRADTTVGALSLSGIYYYGFDRDPVFSTSRNGLIHTRNNKFGYALDYGTSVLGQRLIIRSEGLYTQGQAFGAASDPYAYDGIAYKDTMKLAFALESSVFSDENKIDILYQPIWTRTFGVRDGDSLLHVVNLSHSVRKTNDRLTLSTTAYIDGGGASYGGLSYNVSAGWKFNDFLKATLAYNDYIGGDTNIPWGAYRKWKNVTLDVKYEF